MWCRGKICLCSCQQEAASPSAIRYGVPALVQVLTPDSQHETSVVDERIQQGLESKCALVMHWKALTYGKGS